MQMKRCKASKRGPQESTHILHKISLFLPSLGRQLHGFGLPDSKKFKKSRVDANQRHVLMYLTHLQVPT
jgi:hypothetical protein